MPDALDDIAGLISPQKEFDSPIRYSNERDEMVNRPRRYRKRRFNPSEHLVGTLVVLVFVAMLAFGLFAFKSCYDDHRNQLGFSVLTSITSCSS